MNDVDDALTAVDRIGSYKQPTVGEWAAIRLAEEVRTLRARIAELSADPPCAERDHETGAPMPCAAEVENATLRARVAELERVPCTCDYAGMEGEWHKPFCEIEGGPHVECRYRIAELEAQQGEPTDAEWGVRLIADERGDVAPRGLAELEAREIVERGGPQLWELVARTAAGPWRVQS